MRSVDVVGLGINAIDTVLEIDRFPALGAKERILRRSVQAGGPIATALVTCRRLGLSCRYIGKVGGDAEGRFQVASLRREGLDVRSLRVVRGTPSQSSVIFVDRTSGERTVFWDRDRRLGTRPTELRPEVITSARFLLLDGSDVGACRKAARVAGQAGIPVIADVDTVYEKVESLFPAIDYLIGSADFLPQVTGEADPFRALEIMSRKYKVPSPGMTLGRDGTLLYWHGQFHYSPGFVVETVDTTGAGDVFHGAFIYGLARAWEMGRILDFANAMAALNSMALGARGGIATRATAEKLVMNGSRHINRDYIAR